MNNLRTITAAQDQALIFVRLSVSLTPLAYDANSRVTQLIDDRGAVTAYTYDSLDRQTVMTFNDGSTRDSQYNAASNVVAYTDENGSVLASTFDPLGRKTACTVTPAAGIGGP